MRHPTIGQQQLLFEVLVADFLMSIRRVILRSIAVCMPFPCIYPTVNSRQLILIFRTAPYSLPIQWHGLSKRLAFGYGFPPCPSPSLTRCRHQRHCRNRGSAQAALRWGWRINLNMNAMSPKICRNSKHQSQRMIKGNTILRKLGGFKSLGAHLDNARGVCESRTCVRKLIARFTVNGRNRP